MPIPVNQGMVNFIAGEDLWEQENISYSIDLESAGHQTAAAEDKFGSPPAFVPVTPEDKAAIQETVELWDDLIDNSITENDVDSAVISINQVTNIPSYSGGVTFGTLHQTISGPDNEGVYLKEDAITVGSYTFTSAIHEFGHALGLSHPGDYNADVNQPIYQNDRMFDEDTQLFSIMSYFAPSDNPSYANVNWSAGNIRTPMIYDVLAIQQLYGADTTTRTGDTTYGFNTKLSDFRNALDQSVFTFTQTANVASPTDPTSFHFEINPAVFTIWDAGGDHDRIDASGFTMDQRIDLNPGTYSDIGETTAPDDPNDPNSTVHLVTLIDSIGIAFGTTIEEAIGGSGNDTITGNDVANYLDGGAGNDTIYGGAGDDVLVGGDDTDSSPGHVAHNDDYLAGGIGDDQLYGGLGNDRLFGGTDNDFLSGGDGDDALSGEGGIDTLDGGNGNDWLDGGGTLDTPGGPGLFGDILTGGDGDDTFVYGIAYGPTGITDFSQGISGNSDTLDLSRTSVHNFTALLAIASQQGDETVFDFGGMNKLTLQNFQLGTLTPEGIAFSEDPNSPRPDFLLVPNPLAGQTNRGIGTEIASLQDNGFAAIVIELDSSFVPRLLLERYDERGVLVSTTAPNSSPGIGGGQIVALDDGRIVVAWSAYDAANSQNDIRARLFDADLNPLGNDFVVNSTPLVTPSATLLDVVKTPDGGFAISWKSDEDPSQYISEVSRIREYDSSGSPTGNDFVIPTVDPPSLYDIHELALSSGRILYYWTESYSYSVAPFGTIYPDALYARFSDKSVAIRLDHDDYDGNLQVNELADGRIQFSWLSGTHTYLNLDHFSGTETVIFDSDLQGFTKPGTAGDDTLVGGIYNDRLYGLGGDDTLIGGRGPDILDGGPGSDTADYDASLEGVFINLSDAAPESGGHASGDILISIENIRGSSYDDTIIGDDNDNVLHGGYGNDRLDGGGGADQVFGDQGDDTIVLRGDAGAVAHGGSGNDEIDILGNGNTAFGDSGADTYFIQGDNNYVADLDYDGSPSMFVIDGNNNQVFGGWGSNFFRLPLLSHSSGNLLYGGPGDDTFQNTGDGDNNTFYGGEGADTFIGGDGIDLIFTDQSYPVSAGDIVHAGAGDDQVVSKGNQDYLDGESGADTLSLDLSWVPGDILVTYDEHLQKFTVANEGTEFLNFENVEINLGYTNTVHAASFTGSLLLWGNSGGAIDIFEGGSGNDQFYGGGYHDVLTGGDGDDYFNETGVGGNLIDGGAGYDSLSYEFVFGGIYADLAAERVYFGAFGGGFNGDADLANASTFDIVQGIEKIYGTSFNDQFRGTAADETFLPGLGDDGVVGGGGRDTVDYSIVDNRFAVVASLVTGIVTEFAADAETGTRLDTVLSTDHIAGISNLTGSNNDDELIGDAADNVITGGLYDDVLTGNGGADIFVYRDNDGTDTITDFAPGVDRIDLTGVAGKYALSDLNVSQDGANTVISLEPNAAIQGAALAAFAAAALVGPGIVLENVQMGDLTERDFIFSSPSAPNQAPVAAATNTVVTDEDTASTPVAIGASDPDGDTLSYTLKSGFAPTLGTVTFANGSFTYLPSANANGSDSFTIVIDDGHGGMVEQVVSVTINPVNDAPVAALTNTVVTDEGTTSAPVAIGASDVDGDTLSYAIKTGFEPAAGTVAFADGSFTYTPHAGAGGSDTFTIVIDDGHGGATEQVVSVTINPGTTVAAPAVALATDSGIAGDGITNVGTVDVSGLEAGASWEYSVNGGGFVAGTGSSFTLTGDGPKTVLVHQTDTAGNMSGDAILSFALDTLAAAPTVALATDSGIAGDGITNDGTVNVSGLETGASWEYAVNGGAFVAGTGSSFTLSGDGAKTVLVHQTDTAGNTSADAALAFTLDTSAAAPAVALATDSGIAGDGITNDGTVNVSGLETGASLGIRRQRRRFRCRHRQQLHAQRRRREDRFGAPDRHCRQHVRRNGAGVHTRHLGGGAGRGAGYRQRHRRRRHHQCGHGQRLRPRNRRKLGIRRQRRRLRCRHRQQLHAQRRRREDRFGAPDRHCRQHVRRRHIVVCARYCDVGFDHDGRERGDSCRANHPGDRRGGRQDPTA